MLLQPAHPPAAAPYHPLMDITVENQNPPEPIPFKQNLSGNRQVIDNAESRCVITMGMMGSARLMAGNPMMQGKLGRQDRSGRCGKRPLHKALAPGKVHAPPLTITLAIGAETGHVIGTMDRMYPFITAAPRTEAVLRP